MRMRGGKGRDRLESACLAAVHAAAGVLPDSLSELLEVVGADPPADAELSPWFDAQGAGAWVWPWTPSRGDAQELVARRPLVPAGGAWRLVAIHSVVVGPSRFNAELAAFVDGCQTGS